MLIAGAFYVNDRIYKTIRGREAAMNKNKPDYGEPLRWEFADNLYRLKDKPSDRIIGTFYCQQDAQRAVKVFNACAGLTDEELVRVKVNADLLREAIAIIKGVGLCAKLEGMDKYGSQRKNEAWTANYELCQKFIEKAEGREP